MSEMTVVQLLQCFMWAFFGMAPLVLSEASGHRHERYKKSGSDEDISGGAGLLLLATAIQVVGMIAAFKSGTLIK